MISCAVKVIKNEDFSVDLVALSLWMSSYMIMVIVCHISGSMIQFCSEFFGTNFIQLTAKQKQSYRVNNIERNNLVLATFLISKGYFFSFVLHKKHNERDAFFYYNPGTV